MMSSIAGIITEVQSRGIRISENLVKRTGGAGPAEAGSLVIGGFAVSVPRQQCLCGPFALFPENPAEHALPL